MIKLGLDFQVHYVHFLNQRRLYKWFSQATDLYILLCKHHNYHGFDSGGCENGNGYTDRGGGNS